MKTNIFFLSILSFFFLFNSCQDASPQKEKTQISEKNSDKSLLSLCRALDISTDHSTVIILPVSTCKACVALAVDSIESSPEAFILHSYHNKCPSVHSSQTCIQYETQQLAKRRLVNLYPLYVVFDNGKVANKTPL